MTPKEIIDLFDSKFRRLESSNLIRFITDRGCKFSFDFTTNNLGSDAVLPDLEFIESYVLNLRFFIQDNEPTSLRNMGKLYDAHYYGQSESMRDLLNCVRSLIPNWIESGHSGSTRRR